MIDHGAHHPRRLRLPVPDGARRRHRPRRTSKRGTANLDTAAARRRAHAPLPVLRLRQGVRVAPSTRRPQGQPPEADGRAYAGAVRWRRYCVVFSNDDDLCRRPGEAQVHRVSPELLDGAGARRAQEVPLLGRAVSVTHGLRVRVVEPQRSRSQLDACAGCEKVGGGGGGAESLADQEEAAVVGSFLGPYFMTCNNILFVCSKLFIVVRIYGLQSHVINSFNSFIVSFIHTSHIQNRDAQFPFAF